MKSKIYKEHMEILMVIWNQHKNFLENAFYLVVERLINL